MEEVYTVSQEETYPPLSRKERFGINLSEFSWYNRFYGPEPVRPFFDVQELENFLNLKNEVEELKSQIENLQKEQNRFIVYEFEKTTNTNAKKLITDYLNSIKSERRQLSIFELSQKLKLPADQVETILEQLAKTKKIKFL
ncbi:hypothetical protein FJZ53_02120 [Candidatus Woesearchaeota archaeon]|nr:hypothetical protein [Candidatus Woesearchaeota archaeon]